MKKVIMILCCVVLIIKSLSGCNSETLIADNELYDLKKIGKDFYMVLDDSIEPDTEPGYITSGVMFDSVEEMIDTIKNGKLDIRKLQRIKRTLNMQKDFALLEARIGYQFHQKNILREALTHSSYANELRARSKREVLCNERLEFLGDAVLASIVSEYLFLTYPTLPEGELTQRRKAVVQSSALASYAREIDLGAYLLLGNGEEKIGGRERQSTLENAFEALLAAIFLDARRVGEDGREIVRRFLLPFITKELEENYSPIITDPKTELQQLVQQSEGDVLSYCVVGESGPDHDKLFEVEARMNSNVIGSGKGKSKREAEQNAAIEALRLFGEIE